MGWIRVRTAAAAVGLVALLVAGAAYEIAHSQTEARARLREQLAHRAKLAGDFLGNVLLNSNERDMAESYFAGPEPGLQEAIAAFQGPAPIPRVIVLDARGRVLAADPPSLRRRQREIAAAAHVRAALRGRHSLSQVFTAPDGTRVIESAVRYPAKHGTRVFVSAAPVSLIQTAVEGYLPSAPAVAGGRAYVLDAEDQVIAASTKRGIGATISDRALRAALREGPAGSYRDRTFVSVPIGGTAWAVVFSVPTKPLYASVDGATRRTAWALFAAFVAALLSLLAVGATALRRSARLAHERLHDALTGLPNRALFLDRVDRALARSHRSGASAAVLFIDLDRFKRINDSLGHAAGDALLKEVARRLREMVRWMDSVSRFGGDEFLVLCEQLEDEQEALEIASRIQEGLSAPIAIGDRSVSVDCSIGIALYRPDGAPLSAAELVHDGDVAMYRAKRRGRARVELFEAGHQDEAAALELDVEAALRAAVAAGGLRVHYQPIVELPGGALRGVEALARWQRPGHGLVQPDEFIGIAENTATIGLIGEWVLRAAVAEISDWAREGLVGDDFMLSVNVSTRQLTDAGLVDAVAAALRDLALPASSLCLEITESVVADDPELALETLERLHALGVRLAIDDFGVGHSSLGQVARSLPVEFLKLDRSFVLGMDRERERAVVASSATLAEGLGLTPIAEGVETLEQAGELAALGYPLGQGFAFGAPVEGARLRAELLADELPAPLADPSV